MIGYDVIIIGAGPAGLSAALWCAELGLRAIVLEREPEIGGQLLWIYNRIENHLGANFENGREMRERFAAQIKQSNFELRTEAEVVSADLRAKHVTLRGREELTTRSIIIATGLRRRRLNIEGEREFAGRGIIKSGKAERERFAGREVCIIGGGDAAAENALLLAETCSRVALVHHGASLSARNEFVERIATNPRITVFYNSKLRRIVGESEVEAIEIERGDDDGMTQSLIIKTQGVLVRIGYEPNTEAFRDQLKTDADGYIWVTSETETSVPHVFAIGDISNPSAPTISGATGAGATAAKIIYTRFASK
jgi:thioredoxin reductase (NADPH)